MYGIFTYIQLSFTVNVGEYIIHGSCGIGKLCLGRLHIPPANVRLWEPRHQPCEQAMHFFKSMLQKHERNRRQ